MKTIKKESFVRGLSLKPLALSIAMLSASAVATPAMAESYDTLAEAFSGGKPYINLRLRYESSDQGGNATPTADALTLDTVFGYESGEYKGFSFLVEAEDVREVFGVRDFTVPFVPVRPGEFDVVADPETTELDQAYIKYKSGGFSAKLGRQVITHDGHRFIGHVGWRQDRQTFDGLTVNYSDEKFAFTGSYVTQRNRIFAEEADFDSSDVFLNASYKFGYNKVVVYSYLLDNEDTDNELDTYGISYSGWTKFGETRVNYSAEYATQDNDSNGTDADYYKLGAGAKFGPIKFSIDYEVLGSDNGTGAFQTPLATLHKFNGWADVFLVTPGIGLEDFKITFDADIAGGKFKLAYHDFTADDSSANGSDDLGDEVDIQYTRNFGKNVYTGIKYSTYSQGSADTTGFGLIQDTDRFWVWAGFKFK